MEPQGPARGGQTVRDDPGHDVVAPTSNTYRRFCAPDVDFPNTITSDRPPESTQVTVK